MSLPAVLLVTLSRFPSAFRLDSTKVVPAPTPMALQIPYRAILVLAIPKTFLLVQLVVPLSMVWYGTTPRFRCANFFMFGRLLQYFIMLASFLPYVTSNGYFVYVN